MPSRRQLTHFEADLRRGRVRTADNFALVAGFEVGAGGAATARDALKALLRRLPEAERAVFLTHLRDALRGEATTALSFEARADDSSLRRLEGTCTALRMPGGPPLRLFGALVDATVRERAGQTLQESEQRYRWALVAGRMGSWETDLVAKTRTWSQEGMALFGLDLPEGRGQVDSPHDEYRAALHPDDRHLVEVFRRRADLEDSFAADYRIVRPDGTTLWLSGRGLVVTRTPEGRAQRLISIMADVSERRRAEEQLRIERSRLEQALDAGQMGVYDHDLVQGTLWWSPQTYAVFGVSLEHFVPSPATVTALIHPEDRELFLRLRAEAIERRKPLMLQFRIVRPDGELRWVEHFGRADYGADGRVVRSYGITMDITRRKLAEQALIDADNDKNRFIAMLAHELRNPLAPIRNAAALVRRAPQAGLALVRAGELIERQVAQMAYLLDGLLDVSRLTHGQIELRRERFDLTRAVEHAIEVAAPLIDARAHHLQVRLPDAPLVVDGDAARLGQVLSNLLINAAKYTPEGGRIEVEARRQDGRAVVTVRDSGIGIEPSQLPRLFRMFARLPGGDAAAAGGLGIGLAVAQDLAVRHGGSIDAHSDGPGRGSCFTLSLPAAGEAAAPAATGASIEPTPPAAAAPASGLRILVADDLRDNADSLALLLRMSGHEARAVYSGEEALAAGAAFAPHAVLLDIGMPGLGGHETCRQLRALPWGRGIAVVAQTGWGDEQDRLRTEAAGFDLHMVKPIDVDALLRWLAQAAATGSAPASAPAPS